MQMRVIPGNLADTETHRNPPFRGRRNLKTSGLEFRLKGSNPLPCAHRSRSPMGFRLRSLRPFRTLTCRVPLVLCDVTQTSSRCGGLHTVTDPHLVRRDLRR